MKVITLIAPDTSDAIGAIPAQAPRGQKESVSQMLKMKEKPAVHVAQPEEPAGRWKSLVMIWKMESQRRAGSATFQ
jgi:hypothetical protein